MTTTKITTTTTTTTTVTPWDLACSADTSIIIGVSPRGADGGVVVALAFNASGLVRRTVLGDVSGIIPVTASSPNGLAFDAATQTVFVASLSGTRSLLYRMRAGGAVALLGVLAELAGGAAFRGGAYWYTGQPSDRLHRVTFAADGSVATDVMVAAMTSDMLPLNYGDIDFVNNDTLVVSGTTAANQRILALYTLSTNTFRIVGSQPLSGAYGQLAVAFNGAVYMHSTAQGTMAVAALDTGALGPMLATTAPYSDLAAVACDAEHVVPEPPSTTTTTTTPSPLLACVASARLLGVVGVTGRVVMVLGNGTTITLGSVADAIYTSTSSPNALAYVHGTTGLLMASFTPTGSVLYRFDIVTGLVTRLGALQDQAGGAAYRHGAYWYVAQRGDRLRKVTFAPSGAVATDVVVAALTHGAQLLDYGDIDFVADDVLLVSATVKTADGIAIEKRLALYNITSDVLAVLVAGSPTVAAVAGLGQIAVGADGVVYNVGATGFVSEIYSDGRLGTSLFRTLAGITDLASIACTAPASVSAFSAPLPAAGLRFGCPLATNTTHMLFGVTQKRAAQGGLPAQIGGEIVVMINDGAAWTAGVLLSVADVVSPTSTSPNALAYDATHGELYFASFSGAASVLYKINLNTNHTYALGSLGELAGGAAWHNGSYWYTATRADRLRRVTFNAATGLVEADVVAANMTGGQALLDYGDIDFDGAGRVVVSASEYATRQANTALAKELAVYSFAGNSFTRVYSAAPSDAVASQYGQIAVVPGTGGAADTVYNHHSASGRWAAVTPAGLLGPTLITTQGFTDVAAAVC